MAANVENVDVNQLTDLAPSSAKSFDEWFSSSTRNKGMADSNYGLFGDISDFFTGRRTKAEKDYDVYLQNLNTENSYKNWLRELKATQDARDWDKMMSDTQYQRMVEDLKKAGLNPWLAVQSGVSGASVPSSAKANASKTSDYDSPKSKQKSNTMRDLSLLLFAIARLAA